MHFSRIPGIGRIRQVSTTRWQQDRFCILKLIDRDYLEIIGAVPNHFLGIINFLSGEKNEMKPVADPLCVVVPRDEVRRQDIKPALSTLKKLIASPEVARAYRERVDIAFDGYKDDLRELEEIKEVRDYVRKLDAKFPFWLFFLAKNRQGIKRIVSCRLLPFLTDEGKAEHHSRQLEQLLLKRWFPAMSIVAQFAGLSEKEIEDMTGGFLWYVKTGRLRPSINDG
jgi:hypothetical protein